jgi:hypothetical protein
MGILSSVEWCGSDGKVPLTVMKGMKRVSWPSVERGRRARTGFQRTSEHATPCTCETRRCECRQPQQIHVATRHGGTFR